MVNYSQSIIYKLCCRDPSVTDIYVGSTTNFTRRKACHKQRCYGETSKGYNINVYQYIREYGGWDNWDMVEIERYCAIDKKDLHTRERYWLEELGATLNKQIPSRSYSEWKTEWRTENKDRIAEYITEWRTENKDRVAEYYFENKDKILEQQAEYRKENKEKIRERDAKYRKENKDRIAERKAEYYSKNKEQIAEKVECECGSSVRKDAIQRHRRSHKHQKWVEENSES